MFGAPTHKLTMGLVHRNNYTSGSSKPVDASRPMYNLSTSAALEQERPDDEFLYNVSQELIPLKTSVNSLTCLLGVLNSHDSAKAN